MNREPGFESMLQDPRYLGCFTDVLGILSRVCSGQRECSLRVLDQNFDNLKPCYNNLKMYLEAAYTCINGKRYVQNKSIVHVCNARFYLRSILN